MLSLHLSTSCIHTHILPSTLFHTASLTSSHLSSRHTSLLLSASFLVWPRPHASCTPLLHFHFHLELCAHISCPTLLPQSPHACPTLINITFLALATPWILSLLRSPLSVFPSYFFLSLADQSSCTVMAPCFPRERSTPSLPHPKVVIIRTWLKNGLPRLPTIVTKRHWYVDVL